MVLSRFWANTIYYAYLAFCLTLLLLGQLYR
jgi:hypothetical protein